MPPRIAHRQAFLGVDPIPERTTRDWPDNCNRYSYMNETDRQIIPDIGKIDLIVAAVLLLLVVLPLRAAEIQSLASIQLQAESFIANYPYQSRYAPGFRLGKLDSRLRLGSCATDLIIEFARPDRTHGNTALNIQCTRPKPWKIHLPVSVDLYDDVMIAAKPLVKGQFIDESTILYEKRSISQLNNGYFTRDSEVNQLEARRNLARGSILTPANLAARMLVRSGQQVTLVLNVNGIQVKSTGQALQSARLGQVVRVRNSQSSRIVEGVVFGEALVKVGI